MISTLIEQALFAAAIAAIAALSFLGIEVFGEEEPGA